VNRNRRRKDDHEREHDVRWQCSCARLWRSSRLQNILHAEAQRQEDLCTQAMGLGHNSRTSRSTSRNKGPSDMFFLSSPPPLKQQQATHDCPVQMLRACRPGGANNPHMKTKGKTTGGNWHRDNPDGAIRDPKRAGSRADFGERKRRNAASEFTCIKCCLKLRWMPGIRNPGPARFFHRSNRCPRGIRFQDDRPWYVDGQLCPSALLPE